MDKVVMEVMVVTVAVLTTKQLLPVVSVAPVAMAAREVVC